MQESNKTIDSILSEIADFFQKELYLELPPFLTILDHKTQCFHYCGREFYKNIILKSEDMKKRVNEIIKRAHKLITSRGEKFKEWYQMQMVSDGATKEWLNSSTPPTKRDDEEVDIFVHLLLNTPVSRYYGVTGQVFSTNIPRFFYNNKQFVRYSGVKIWTNKDPILSEDEWKYFAEVISILEELFWQNFEIKSAVMAPIFLYGQIGGISFIADTNKELNSYDYLKFLQLAKEFSTTLIKDAKEYEFLSAVLKDLPIEGFDVTRAIFRNLPALFSIVSACQKEKYECKCLSYVKSDADQLFPIWKEKSCHNCTIFERISSKGTIVLNENEICPNLENQYLKPKSGLYLSKRDIILYFLHFDLRDDLLELYKKEIELAVEDAFELVRITDKNTQFHRGYGHDADRLLDDIWNEEIELIFSEERKNYYRDFIKKILENRTDLMIKLFGKGVRKDDDIKKTNFREEVETMWKIYNKKYRVIRKEEEIGVPSLEKIPKIIDTYQPALECILINLIKNTFQNFDEANIENIEISYKNNTLNYTQKGKEFKFKVLPEQVHQYLIGENIDWESLKGLGHYMIQWIVDRFNGDLSIKFKDGNNEIVVRKGSIKKKASKSIINEPFVTYKITFPDEWR